MKKAILLISACLMLAGCGNMTKGKSLAEAQVAIFHEHYNNQEFTDMVDSAHPDMLKASSAEDLTDLYTAIRKKMGKTTGTKTVNWNIRTFNAATTVVLVQDTTFEEGKGQETFTFKIQKENAFLLGYNINSRDLIMK